MTLPALPDASPIGGLPVSEVLGSLGDLTGKTLVRLTGNELPDGGATSLIQRAASAWKTPLEALTCEQLRLLLSQGMGTPWIAPLACSIVTRLPNAMVTFHPGDLALTILRKFPAVYEADPEGARALLVADSRWIEGLREADVEFGTGDAAEAEDLLRAARQLAMA